MAQATKTIATREVITKIEEEVVIITLTKNEAETLLGICGRVTGDYYYSRQKHVENIWDALQDAGVDPDAANEDFAFGAGIDFLSQAELVEA